jgi:DNA-binding response OmpR family regulator
MNLEDCLILIIEDEPVIGLVLEDKLRDRGARTLLAHAYEVAQQAIDTEAADAAILDINLHGQQSYPLARMLKQQGVPFIFLTGYGDALHPADLAEVITITKPYDVPELEDALSAILQGRNRPPLRKSGGFSGVP